MTTREFGWSLCAVLLLAALSLSRLAWGQEPAEPTKEELAAKRAYLRTAARGLVESGLARERLVDPETGTVHQRLCGVVLPTHPGLRLCLHREWDSTGVKRLRQLTREDTGFPIGVVRRWDAAGVLVEETRHDAQGRRHGTSTEGGHVDVWSAGALVTRDGVPVEDTPNPAVTP